MVQAGKDITPIEWWTLDDLLEYLTLAPFRYEIDEALRRMERAFSTGDVPLIIDNYFDGKIQSYEIDPFRFHTKYSLEFDYFNQRVLLVPRGGHEFSQKRGRVVKQDPLRVWPLRPPASQTAPVRRTDIELAPAAPPPPPPKTTAGAEPLAITHLTPMLKLRGDAMSKDEAWKQCKQFTISGAGFRYRVWPTARQQAGLEPKAPAGKKRRKPTEIEPEAEQIIGPKKSGRESSR
jgi:hypothetical protein